MCTWDYTYYCPEEMCTADLHEGAFWDADSGRCRVCSGNFPWNCPEEMCTADLIESAYACPNWGAHMEGKCCLGDADMDPKLAGESCAVGMDVGGEYGEEGDNEGEKWVSLDNVPWSRSAAPPVYRGQGRVRRASDAAAPRQRWGGLFSDVVVKDGAAYFLPAEARHLVRLCTGPVESYPFVMIGDGSCDFPDQNVYEVTPGDHVADCVRACAEDAACIALDAVVTQRRLSACMLYLGRPEIIDLVYAGENTLDIPVPFGLAPSPKDMQP